MRNKILVMAVLAVAGGGGSLFAARTWLDGQASRRMAAIEAARPEVTFATLVVAAEPLRFGATLSPSNLKAIPWPSGDLPPGAFADIDSLMKDGPRRVLSPMELSEPVLAPKITGPGEGAQLSRVLAEGSRAVSIRVDDVAGVAGFLVPGDRVDVVLTRDVDGTNRGNVILQGVKVLTIDQSADQRADQPQIARAVTVEVDPAGAQKIALARAIGSLSLALRPAGEAAPAAVAGITADDLTSTTKVEAPVALAAAPAAVPASADDGTTVWVSRAFQRTAYKVISRDRPQGRTVEPEAAPVVVAPRPAAPPPPADDIPVSENPPVAPHLVADRTVPAEDTDVR